jgi:hypothetical protein
MILKLTHNFTNTTVAPLQLAMFQMLLPTWHTSRENYMKVPIFGHTARLTSALNLPYPTFQFPLFFFMYLGPVQLNKVSLYRPPLYRSNRLNFLPNSDNKVALYRSIEYSLVSKLGLAYSSLLLTNFTSMLLVTETEKLNIAPRLEMRDIGQFSVRRESKTKERRRV